MRLSEMAVRNSRPSAKPYKLADGGGMYLLVTTTGKRYWRLDYRFGGKRKTLALGVYPETSLKAARDMRASARRQIEDGVDPGHRRKIEKLTGADSQGNSFRLICEELLAKMEREQLAEITVEKARWMLGFAYPTLGERPISEITAPEILIVLRSVEARGRFETARRLRSRISQAFRLAIATGRAERDPTIDLRGAIAAPKVTHRAAITDPKKIGPLLVSIDEFTGHETTRAALNLLALTFVRPGELRNAEWSEFDLEKDLWVIPAAKMKMRRPHKVPLARQSRTVLEKLRSKTGTSRYLFPAVNSWVRPMSENTLNCALRRLGYTKEEMTAHGFRSMAATLLNEMGKWPGDAIERQLAHQEANAVRRAYTHAAEYWPDRVVMMQVWADFLDELRAKAGRE